MAETKKKSFPTFTSPKGTFVWPRLNEVDYGTEKYPCKEGQYTVTLQLKADDPATKAFIKKLEPHWRDAIEDGKQAFAALGKAQQKKLGALTENPFFTDIYVRDANGKETDEKTGDIAFKFKMKASGTYKKGPKAGKAWTRKPDIFDAKGLRMAKAPNIWSGTTGKVSFNVSPYFVDGQGTAGLRFGLDAAQIIDLVSEGTRAASSYGFGAEEGYAHEDIDEEKPDGRFAEGGEDAADASDDDGSGDF